MFIGSINSRFRDFLATLEPQLKGKNIIVGCSGNFTSEAVLSKFAHPKAIYSNDISLYSGLAGAYFMGQDFKLNLTEDSLEWLKPFLTSTPNKLAAVMVLLDVLPFEKQNNAYSQRMWKQYIENFDVLVEKTLAKIANTEVRIDGYFAGDVADHFKQHADDPEAVFMCFAPTYAGGYERLYKRIESIFEWDAPTYPMLDEAARNALFDWTTKREYVWYDDRILEGHKVIMVQKAGRKRTVYAYSNLEAKTVYINDIVPAGLPKIPLANDKTVITPASHIELVRIKTSDLARFKNAFLGKNILFSQGNWAFTVMVDGVAVGFIEYSKEKFGAYGLYINSDFAIPSTQYKRLSKLVVMLAISGETRRMMERINILRLKEVCTTAFTARPVSMKYRGILNLVKRGKDKDGKPFLDYQAEFNELSWKEVLLEWLTKHGSQNSLPNSTTD